jgi:hypothetical protein
LGNAIGAAAASRPARFPVCELASRLARLAVDGHLAAYVLDVPDGTAYRLLDGRFVGTLVPATHHAGSSKPPSSQRLLDDPRLNHPAEPGPLATIERAA